MSVYQSDNCDFFVQAIDSMLNQTIKSDDFVLVIDGPIFGKLKNVVKEYANKYKEIHLISLEKNMSLGNALAEGMKHCRYELVARMDSDDISIYDRCEKQLKTFAENPDLDILSGQVAEFENDIKHIFSYRKIPVKHEDIVKFAKRYSPFNHPVVMYKKSSVISVGGYQDFLRNEDYYLWVRMIMNGAKTQNLPDTLLYYRASYENIQRKSSWSQTKNSIKLHYVFQKMGFASFMDTIFLMCIHLTIFLMPTKFFWWAYKNIR
jgi:glycosyltransferase involved in cell wall biosynthesis